MTRYKVSVIASYGNNWSVAIPNGMKLPVGIPASLKPGRLKAGDERHSEGAGDRRISLSHTGILRYAQDDGKIFTSF